MSYRFQKFTSVYPDFAEAFMRKESSGSGPEYSELLDRFIATRYGLSDYYASNMRMLGNEAEEVFASVEILQKAWARDKGVRFRRSKWIVDIVLEQVRTFHPDVIFLQDLFFFNESFRGRIRSAAPNHALMIGWRASPTQDFESFRDLDLVLTAFAHLADRWKSLGIKSHVLPLAFDPVVLEEIQEPNRSLDLTFVGQTGGPSGWHEERRLLLEELIRTTPLQVWGSASRPRLSPRDRVLRSLRHRSVKPLRGERRQDPGLSAFKPAVFGLDYYRILARSKVTLNHHSYEASGPHAGNVRMYEATGMGACLLNDKKKDLGRYFELDREVVAYENESECAAKALYLLDNPAERNAIATAGQRRTLTSHTYERRTGELDRIIKQLLASKNQRG